VRRSQVDAWCAAVSAVCFAGIALCILAPAPSRILSVWSSATIYPWWTLALAVSGVGLALVSTIVRKGGSLAVTSAAMAGVFAAELAGSGLVARKHWHPAFGMGGGYLGDLRDLQWLALVVFAAGTTAAVASLARLVVAGALPQHVPRWLRWGSAVAGLLVVALLPVGIGVGGGADDTDATSLAAYALIYAAPWGLSIVLTAWLTPTAARAVMAACAVCALLALIGPQMLDLVYPQPHLAFALALAVMVVVLLARSRSVSDTSSR
jgi:hypothetical protein